MKNYSEINKSAFEVLAHEYQNRWKGYLEHQESVLERFEKRLKQGFRDPIKVLDAGCGVGLDTYILTEHGFKVFGIDAAESMIAYARHNVPLADFKVADFLDYSNDDFQGIVMDAFLHLFPMNDVFKILAKAKSVLALGGYGLICTTRSGKTTEGYMKRIDYSGGVRRFRRNWTERELKDVLEQSGFKIVDFYMDHEPIYDKCWMNVIFRYVRL